MKKLCIAIVLGLFSVATLIGLAAWLSKGTSPPFDDSDLLTESIEVPPEENAFTYLSAASDLLYWPKEGTLVSDYLNGESADKNQLADLLSRNSDLLAELAEAVKQSTYQSPRPEGYESIVSHISPFLRMGRIQAVSVQYIFDDGRVDPAIESCITLLRFADLIQRHPETTVEYLVGLTLLDVALDRTRLFANSGSLSQNDLERMAAAVANIGHPAPGLIRAVKSEYRAQSDLVARFADGRLTFEDLSFTKTESPIGKLIKGRRTPRFMFNSEHTRLIFARTARSVIDQAFSPYSDVAIELPEFLADGYNVRSPRNLLTANFGGKLLVTIVMPAWESVMKRKCAVEANLSATRALLAIHLFYRQHGGLPNALSDLVPDRLESVPVDPFDGKPLRYRPEAWILYSVGKDGLDQVYEIGLPAKKGSVI